MTSVFKHKWRVALATVALGAIGMSGTAFAQTNTLAGTSITNTATVNYSVASIAQTPINAAATFVVDAVIKVSVTPVASALPFTPGQTNVAKAFTVTNSGNKASNYVFTPAPTNLTGTDQFDINNINVRVDSNGNGVYDPGTDNATTITGLARETSATVFVVGDIPGTATNADTAIVQLDVMAIDPTTSAEWANDTNPDAAMTEQVVVSNTTTNAQNTFVVASAALSVAKLSRVIWDPVNLFATPKAIPSAIMEYEITVTNAVGAQTATLTSISDPVPANTAFKTGEYTGSRDVGVKIGAAAEFFCIAEVGTDSNGDGCSLNGGAVTVGAPAITTIAANTSIVVRFRVTIN
jgi:hypothetical protein